MYVHLSVINKVTMTCSLYIPEEHVKDPSRFTHWTPSPQGEAISHSSISVNTKQNLSY